MGKNQKYHHQTKMEFDIFKKSKETTMSFLFIFNDPKLSESAKLLFHYIYSKAISDSNNDFSDNTLRQNVGITASAVKSGIKELKQRGWIKTEMVATRIGSKRSIVFDYRQIRKACPRKTGSEYELGSFKDFATNKKDKINPNAIATYVICSNHNQMFMSLRPMLYNRTLTPRSRVLFQIISSLILFKGYCFAGNNFFEEKLGVNQTTISKHLTLLENDGVIRIEYGGQRKIYFRFDELKKRFLKKV